MTTYNFKQLIKTPSTKIVNSPTLPQSKIHKNQRERKRKKERKKENIYSIMSAYGFTLSLMLLLLVSYSEASTSALQANGSATSNEIMMPLMEPVKVMEMKMMVNESRRKLGSFQICALCTCCGGARGICLPSPCCYAINCNIPNRPFGFCSFTPKTCNCFGCHI